MNREEVMLAKLANPYSDDKVKLDVSLNERLLKFIDENKISLLLKEKGVETEIARRDEKKLEILIREMKEVAKEFERRGIDYVIIKFPELPRAHRDIDILVNHSQIKSVDEILGNLGYKKKDAQEVNKKAYAKVISGDIIDIDVHLEFGWWGVTYLRSNSILEHSGIWEFKDFEIRRPCAEYELLMHASTILFGELRLTLFDLIYAKVLIDKVDSLSHTREIASNNNWLRQFDYFIEIINILYNNIWGHHSYTNLNISFPYRIPVSRIFLTRMGKMASDFKSNGLRMGIKDLWGYLLEISQLGIDYVRERFGIPSHPIFNMRRFLWGGNHV